MKYFFKTILLVVSLLTVTFSVQSCIEVEGRFSSVAPGTWRCVLQLESSNITSNKKGEPLPEKMNLKYEDATNGELPFLMEIKYLNDSTFSAEIINGVERIKIDPKDISKGHSRQTGRDTLLIRFPIYDSYLRAVFQERVMEGEFVTPRASIPFIAHNGQGYRFTTVTKKPVADISGKWETTLGLSDSVPEQAIGEFAQSGNHLSGTFMTETGDYRYLDGEIQADKIYLSCFDGAHAYLFEAKIKGDSLYGTFRSGRSYKTTWVARRNPRFKLRNADSLTFLKAGYSALDFNFPNTEGQMVGMKNYQGKVTIVQIMGTWCPNCRDESNFLVGYLQNNNNPNLAVVGLSFERTAEKGAQLIKTYKNQMHIPYEILLAGTSNKKDEAAKALPMLNSVVAFPTTIFVDKKGKVRKIYTGFNGPATSEYAAYQKSFDIFVKSLLAE
jgi:peroxiredoxin